MAEVVGILGIAFHAATKVIHIIKSIKDAPSEIQALREDAVQVHGFLDKLLCSQDEGPGEENGSLHTGNVQDPQIAALVKKAQVLTTTVDTFISRTAVQKDDKSFAVKKLKWLRYTGEAKKLSKQFRSFHLSLTAAYSVLASYVLLLLAVLIPPDDVEA